MKRVYVATAFSNWAEAKRVEELIKEGGMQPTSSWVKNAEIHAGRELDTPGAVEAAHRQNYIDLRESNAILVLRRDSGGEMFVEFITAVQWKIPVVWVGRPILSARFHEGHGVTFAASIGKALEVLDAIPC